MSSIAWKKITVKFNALSVQIQIKDIYAGTTILQFRINKCSWDLAPSL